jgi:TPR repeat protein|tara:strand:+ start:31735 stop:34125 length:2391 start_codon:yes stop_codon:yes gene_type:complete
MKLLSSLLFIALFFVACSNINPENRNIESKEILIQKANNNNIDAMLDLVKYYKFPETKEGLYYFNKWYPLIEKSKDTQGQTNIAEIYYKYADMFINGKEKATNLLIKTSDLGDIKSSVLLIKIYLKGYASKDANKLLNKIIDKLSKEQLSDLYTEFSKKYNSKPADKILETMKSKGYEEPFIVKMKYLRSLIYSKKDTEKEKVSTFVNEVIASKNIENMTTTAQLLRRQYYYRNDAIRLYEEVIKYDPSNAQAYYDIYRIFSFSREKDGLSIDKKTAINYLEKASDLSNEEASNELLRTYARSQEYINKYTELKEKLLQNDTGKFVLAKYYKTHGKNNAANGLFEELAKKGNIDAIVELTTRTQSKYSFDPEEFQLIKKWQEYAIKSDDKELKKEIIKKITLSYRKKYFADFLEKLKESDTQDYKNILTLRSLAKQSYRDYDYQEAIIYYDLASSYGDVFSKIRLAKLYLNSKVNQYDKAVEILEELTNKGDKEARKELIYLYTYPPAGYEKQPLKAMEIYKKHAQKGDIRSIEKLAIFYICDTCGNGKYIDYKEGLKYLNQLIERRGEARDYATLAWLYNFGKGLDIDLQKAKENYLIAIEKGYTRGYYNLASLYYQKDKTLPIIRLDYKEALKYLQLGYEHHDEDSAFLLAKFYEKGFGVEKNLEKAVEYYKRVARSNDSVSNFLGNYYRKRKDYENARKYFSYAARNNYGGSLLDLGVLYEKGLGGKKDIYKAIEYYERAYKNNTSQKDIAAYNLGLVYQYGKDKIKKDIEKAKEWYKNSNYKKAKNKLKELK